MKKKRSSDASFFYLSNIRHPDTITKKENNNLTVFNFNFVNKNDPKKPPITAGRKSISILTLKTI